MTTISRLQLIGNKCAVCPAHAFIVINPRRTCARVTVVVLCVCVSVPALAASAPVYIRNHRYSQVSLGCFLDFDSWILEKTFRSKVMA